MQVLGIHVLCDTSTRTSPRASQTDGYSCSYERVLFTRPQAPFTSAAITLDHALLMLGEGFHGELLKKSYTLVKIPLGTLLNLA